jgi:hypothetical protein
MQAGISNNDRTQFITKEEDLVQQGVQKFQRMAKRTDSLE